MKISENNYVRVSLRSPSQYSGQVGIVHRISSNGTTARVRIPGVDHLVNISEKSLRVITCEEYNKHLRITESLERIEVVEEPEIQRNYYVKPTNSELSYVYGPFTMEEAEEEILQRNDGQYTILAAVKKSLPPRTVIDYELIEFTHILRKEQCH